MEGIPVQKEFGEIRRNENHFEIRKFGTDKVVGELDFYEYERPIKHYYLADLRAVGDEQGKGYASQLMAEMESLSDESHVPVVVIDGIDKHDPGQNARSVGMYGRRRGWIPMSDEQGMAPGHYIYGLEDKDMLRKFIDQYNGTGKLPG
jgi:hypothetical protein